MVPPSTTSAGTRRPRRRQRRPQPTAAGSDASRNAPPTSVAGRDASHAASAPARRVRGPGTGPAPPTAPPAAPSPRRPEAPAVGSLAPDFTLRARGGATTRTLSDLRGTPVVLVFGSYTCPPFRASAGWIRAAYDRHATDARFLFVYVREAHAIDGRAPMPDADQPVVEEPATFEDRRAVADVCALDLRFGVFETLVDGLDDAVARAYVAPPARLYVVGRDGKVAYRSGPGPFGLRQAEFDDAVRRGRDVALRRLAPPTASARGLARRTSAFRGPAGNDRRALTGAGGASRPRRGAAGCG